MIQVRPFRFVYVSAIMVRTVYCFGWPPLIPLLLVAIDVEKAEQ